MEHELQGKLVEILTSIQSGVGQAKDFALSQLPDIAQSYIVYGRASSIIYLVLSLAALIAIAVIVWRAEQEPVNLPPGGALMIGLPASILPIVGVLININNALLVWFAPKVWLLKELAHLIK